MDGLETAAMIRQRRQTAQTPIIFITAFGDDVHSAQGYSLGAVDYIHSPVVPEILRTKVSVFVELFKKTLQVRRQAEERVALAREQAARAAAEEANRRSAFLAEASKVLTKSLDYDATLRGVARLLVPSLGEFAAVTLVDDRSGVWDNLVVLIDPDDQSRKKFRCSEAELDAGLAEAIRGVLDTGTPVDVPAVRAEGPWGGAMVLPLEARGRVMGTLALNGGTSGPRPVADDRRLAEDLAGRAAIAIDNARLYRDIQEDDRRKNEFLAMLAHELRNPLAPIRNAVKILQQIGADEGDLGWACGVISRQVEQMVRLVDDLLDISRITGGKIQLHKETLDVATAVSYAVETSRPLVEARNQTLSVEMPREPIWVQADKARLSQVLANVLNNAAKYTGDGGRIDLAVGRDGDDVVFRVRDTGIGIPADMLTKVFDLFTQVDRSLDRAEGGLGIGLTLVRRLMEKHGGSVQARSEGPGRGSEFLLRMPALPAAGPCVGAPPSPSAGSEGRNGDLGPPGGHQRPSRSRILIVDDNTDAARSLARLVRLAGHDVVTADDGPGALAKIGEFNPEFILLDIGLPGMDGYEVARNIRARPDSGGTVLIALTGYGREEDRNRSRESGFDHHFVKPVELDALFALFDCARGMALDAAATTVPTQAGSF
jgi:signal transduction histidine kinase/DNA-binding response OmpR family regulator